MKIRIGTRGSKLAVAQTEWVAEQLRRANPKLETECVIIKTLGDRIQDVALDKLGDKGVFVKELELALLNGDVDLAVHSLKDMPAEWTPGLAFAPTPFREDSRDVLVLRPEYRSLAELPQGARIGTGSKRRRFQLLQLRPDLELTDIRGNIETRISKIESENLHGVVLAAAGMHRIGIRDRITCYLEPEDLLPAPAQGALALQHREGDAAVVASLESLTDTEAAICVSAERSFLKHTHGGCHAPVGAYGVLVEGRLILTGLFGTQDGSRLIRKTLEGPTEQAEELGKALAEAILEELK